MEQELTLEQRKERANEQYLHVQYGCHNEELTPRFIFRDGLDVAELAMLMTAETASDMAQGDYESAAREHGLATSLITVACHDHYTTFLDWKVNPEIELDEEQALIYPQLERTFRVLLALGIELDRIMKQQTTKLN